MQKNINEFIAFLTIVPKFVYKLQYLKGEVAVYIKEPSFIIPFLDFLKDHSHSRFKLCMDICGVDLLASKENGILSSSLAFEKSLSKQAASSFGDIPRGRFLVVYNCCSIEYNTRIRIYIKTNETSAVESVTGIYPSAAWWEREVWDMFGIYFSNHPDLRRILTDYGFQGHPLRKDFPCSGYNEVRYDDSEKRVVCEPIEMTQELRYFEFSSPWPL
jgi:NADH/F420H2 dehydrogenase subunit C